MAACSASCVEILKKQLKMLNGHVTLRALDVAGGEGRLSRKLLLKQYDTVDLFDQCAVGVKKAKKALHAIPREVSSP